MPLSSPLLSFPLLSSHPLSSQRQPSSRQDLSRLPLWHSPRRTFREACWEFLFMESVSHSVLLLRRSPILRFMIVFQLLLSFQNEPVRKLKETKQEIKGSSLLHPSPRVTGVE